MARRVAIIDTSLMCCWLKVPGRLTAGSEPDRWDFDRTKRLIDDVVAEGYELVFPLTTLLETGNHIANSVNHRFEKATEFMDVLATAAAGDAPWANFGDQFETIRKKSTEAISAEWPVMAARGVSLGDYLITAVADYYSLADFDVQIMSSDRMLRSHVSPKPDKKPRRRS